MKRSRTIWQTGVLMAALGLLSACAPTASRGGQGAHFPAERSCRPGNPGAHPCVMPFDSGPVLVEAPPVPGDAGDVRGVDVWVFVSDSGSVDNAQIQRTSGVLDFDSEAVKRAREMRFEPARLGGNPVAAWVSLRVETARPPRSCSTMSVPLSAGVAVFADSSDFERPELGWAYRFTSPFFSEAHVYIYPQGSFSSPEEQGSEFVELMNLYREQGRFDAVKVVRSGRRTIEVEDENDRPTDYRGHEVVVELEQGGRRMESYFFVVPVQSKYVKFRVTYPPAGQSRGAAREFVWQVLSSVANSPEGCWS